MTIMQERPAPLSEASISETEPQEEFLRPRRWTRDEYYRLGEAGFFDDERVELLDGEIWTLPPQGTPHFSAVEASAEVLLAAFGEGYTVRRHGPLTLDDGTEPEPDVLIVPGTRRDYEGQHPTLSKVRLLVEVSDATLAKDRGKKLRDYARAGVADYWIVNLVDRQLEIYREPSLLSGSHGYKFRQVLFEGDTVTPLSAPEVLVAVTDLFPLVTNQP